MYAYIYRKNAKIYSKIVVALPSTTYLCSFSITQDDNLDCAVPPQKALHSIMHIERLTLYVKYEISHF